MSFALSQLRRSVAAGKAALAATATAGRAASRAATFSAAAAVGGIGAGPLYQRPLTQAGPRIAAGGFHSTTSSAAVGSRPLPTVIPAALGGIALPNTHRAFTTASTPLSSADAVAGASSLAEGASSKAAEGDSEDDKKDPLESLGGDLYWWTKLKITLKIVEPNAALLPEILALYDDDPEIRANASADGPGQDVYEVVDLPADIAAVLRAFAPGHPNLFSTDKLYVRKRDIAGIETAFDAALAGKAGNICWYFEGPAGQGKSRRLLSVLVMALLQSDGFAGRSLVLHKGPGPKTSANDRDRLPGPFFRFWRKRGGEVREQTFASREEAAAFVVAEAKAGRRAVFLYDGNARIDLDVLDLLREAHTVTAMSPGSEPRVISRSGAVAMRRLPVKPLSPREFVVIAAEIKPDGVTEDDIVYSAGLTGLNLRRALCTRDENDVEFENAQNAVRGALRAEADKNPLLLGMTEDEILAHVAALTTDSNATTHKSKGLGVGLLLPYRASAKQGGKGSCWFASKKAKAAVEAAAKQAFANNRAKKEEATARDAAFEQANEAMSVSKDSRVYTIIGVLIGAIGAAGVGNMVSPKPDAEAEARKVEAEARKAEIAAEVRKAEIAAEVRKAEIAAAVEGKAGGSWSSVRSWLPSSARPSQPGKEQ